METERQVHKKTARQTLKKTDRETKRTFISKGIFGKSGLLEVLLLGGFLTELCLYIFWERETK